jgi:hypothetical protein
LIVDAILSKCQALQALPEFKAHFRQAWAVPADAMTICLEILKFLGTLALITVTALIMLMAG